MLRSRCPPHPHADVSALALVEVPEDVRRCSGQCSISHSFGQLLVILRRMVVFCSSTLSNNTFTVHQYRRGAVNGVALFPGVSTEPLR